MHLLPQLVDAAIAEDRAPEQRTRLVQVKASAKREGFDALVPIAADVRQVAILRGRDDEGEFPPMPVVAKPKRRRQRDALIVCAARPRHAVVQPDDRHVGAADRRTRVEARHERQGVLRAVLDGDAQVRHLHNRGDRRGFFPIGMRARDRLAGLDGGPHEARA